MGESMTMKICLTHGLGLPGAGALVVLGPILGGGGLLQS